MSLMSMRSSLAGGAGASIDRQRDPDKIFRFERRFRGAFLSLDLLA